MGCRTFTTFAPREEPFDLEALYERLEATVPHTGPSVGLKKIADGQGGKKVKDEEGEWVVNVTMSFDYAYPPRAIQESIAFIAKAMVMAGNDIDFSKMIIEVEPE